MLSQAVQTFFTNAEGKYLMQMRNNHPDIMCPLQWGFFGGGVEGDETFAEAACRETFEEMGMRIQPTDLEELGSMEHPGVPGQMVYMFRCRTPIEWSMIKLAEGAGAGYFSFDEIQLIDASPVVKEIAKRFL